MARKIDIALKKLPKQSRAIATVDALVEAATYILARNGPAGFTANKVADKAGVNIASFYQYFPNKEALIFHIIQQTWERQFARLGPILTRPGHSHADKLRDFIREFFLIEAAEVDMRRALRAASVELRETKEYKQLLFTGGELLECFISESVNISDKDEHRRMVHFILVMITSFAERTTDEGTSGDELIRQAELLTDMLVAQFLAK